MYLGPSWSPLFALPCLPGPSAAQQLSALFGKLLPGLLLTFPTRHCAGTLLHIRGLNHGAAVKISRVNINNEGWEGSMCHVPRDNVRADCDVSRAYTCNATNTDGQLVTIISQQLSSTLHHYTLDTGLGVSHDGYLKTVRCAMHGLP